MKIFRLMQDSSFGGFFTWKQDEAIPYRLTGVPLSSSWKPLPVYWDRPDVIRPNIAHSWGGGFAVDRQAEASLRGILSDCCELLPLESTQENRYQLLNPLITVDCLDKENTKYRPGSKSMIERFEFTVDRLPMAAIFRLPRRPEWLTISGRGSDSCNFKSMVEQSKLTGLRFIELWSSGA